MTANQDIGYIYCITNPSMPGVVKIGMTRRTPEKRLADANHDTWNHTKFQLEFAKKVHDPEEKEKTIHKILELHGQRKTTSREFFTISPELARLYFDLVEGEEYLDFLEKNIAVGQRPTAPQSAQKASDSTKKASEKDVQLCSSILKKKEYKPRKKNAPVAQVAQVADDVKVAEPGAVNEAINEVINESIDIFTLFSQSIHDSNGWPPVQHLNSYESYLLLSTAFEKKLLRLLIRGTPYQFDELNQVDATALRGSTFELIDNKGYLVTSSRVDELFERMQKREYVTLCTGTGQWRT
jgi:hypothetical protein